jgi:radical SAM superfamily enzyme YgiQ (UPF0313 family)
MAEVLRRELVLVNPRASYFFIDLLQRVITGNPVPYVFLILSALTPRSWGVRFINKKDIWFPWEFKGGRLVGITCLTASVTEAYRLADRFRKAGSKVVLGGPHVSARPDEALVHADSVVIGEAESAWPQILKDYEAGSLQPKYLGQPLDDFFSPVFDYFLKLDPGTLGRAGIHVDRGCKYNCDFCAKLSGRCRFIKLEQVLALIQKIKGASKSFFGRKPFIVFRCDNIFSNPAYAKKLFRELAALNVHWGANCSIDIAFDEEALQLAQASGCRGLLVGFETVHPREFKKTDLAQINSGEDYIKAVNRLRRHKIGIIGSFIVGFDDYRPKDYRKLLWLLLRLRLHHSLLTILTPYPGSRLFDRLKSEGRIFSYDWKRYNFLNCVFKPKHTSVPGLYAWFFLIRVVSLCVSPQFIMSFIYVWVIYTLSYHASQYVMYGRF